MKDYSLLWFRRDFHVHSGWPWEGRELSWRPNQSFYSTSYIVGVYQMFLSFVLSLKFLSQVVTNFHLGWSQEYTMCTGSNTTSLYKTQWKISLIFYNRKPLASLRHNILGGDKENQQTKQWSSSSANQAFAWRESVTTLLTIINICDLLLQNRTQVAWTFKSLSSGGVKMTISYKFHISLFQNKPIL